MQGKRTVEGQMGMRVLVVTALVGHFADVVTSQGSRPGHTRLGHKHERNIKIIFNYAKNIIKSGCVRISSSPSMPCASPPVTFVHIIRSLSACHLLLHLAPLCIYFIVS